MGMSKEEFMNRYMNDKIDKEIKRKRDLGEHTSAKVERFLKRNHKYSLFKREISN